MPKLAETPKEVKRPQWIITKKKLKKIGVKVVSEKLDNLFKIRLYYKNHSGVGYDGKGFNRAMQKAQRMLVVKFPKDERPALMVGMPFEGIPARSMVKRRL